MFKPTVKTNIKKTLKRQAKKLVQTFYMPEKDKGKKVYFDALKLPIKDNYVFYEAFAGLGILDNPRAIFKYLLSQPDFKDFVHVWSIDNLDLAKTNTEEFSDLDNVIIIKKDSLEYYKYLATCKYLISNSTFGYFFMKRSKQVYINTWHGVPTKYMGYEHTVERVENARGPARNFLQADYLISANRFMTEAMYGRSYKMNGICEAKVLELGYPRSDAIINVDNSSSEKKSLHYDSEYVYKKLNDIGIKTDKKIILYAPTWKGNLYNQLEYNVSEFKNIVEKLSESIDKENYCIYLRVHYFLYKILATDPDLEKILVPFTIDTNELLSVVDVLISDYSSIFFDYLPTENPMIFYVPDLDEYISGRGLYVPVEKLPGLVSSDINDISNALTHICADATEYLDYYYPLLHEMKEWCSYNDDGNACQRIVDIIFRNKDYLSSESLRIVNNFNANKKKMLICVNTRFGNNNFYNNLKTKLENIDYEKTDVTLLATSFKEDKYKSYFNNLPEEVRILVWYGLPFVTPTSKDFYKNEFIRSLGYVKFDEVLLEGEITEYWADFANNI